MSKIVILIIVLTVLTLILIQTVTIRLNWQEKLVISIDYMFITFYYTVKKGNKNKKSKRFIAHILKFIKKFLSYSSVTLHKALISFSCSDYTEGYIADGAIRSVLFPTISAVKALSKDFIIDDGAIETRYLTDEITAPKFDISFKIRLYYVLLSFFSFSKNYLKKKAKDAK